jgi:hypothetical protein
LRKADLYREHQEVKTKDLHSGKKGIDVSLKRLIWAFSLQTRTESKNSHGGTDNTENYTWDATK